VLSAAVFYPEGGSVLAPSREFCRRIPIAISSYDVPEFHGSRTSRRAAAVQYPLHDGSNAFLTAIDFGPKTADPSSKAHLEEANLLNHAPSCDTRLTKLAQVSGFRDQGTEIRNRKIHT
jgi:hypothetical protein